MRLVTLVRGVMMGAVPLVGIAVASHFYAKSQRYVTTENAYVRAEVVTISAEIDGRLAFINAHENMRVEAGEALFGLDTRPLEADLRAAEAELAGARLQVEALRARYAQEQADIATARENVRFLETEYQRQKKLAKKGHGTQAKLEAAEHELAIAKRKISAGIRTAGITLAELGGASDLPTDDHPWVRRAVSKVDSAEVALERATFAAPISGFVGAISAQEGEYVEAGDALFAVVDDGGLWIQANLKEVHLTHVRIGQDATVVLDGYPDISWHATVDSISPATGSEFALLPAQNASGNWVKVVQRVPVRLKLKPIGKEDLLRAGMTAYVKIDTERDHDLVEFARGVLAGATSQ